MSEASGTIDDDNVGGVTPGVGKHTAGITSGTISATPAGDLVVDTASAAESDAAVNLPSPASEVDNVTACKAR